MSYGLAGRRGQGGACMEDKDGFNNKEKYHFKRNLDRGIIQQFEIKRLGKITAALSTYLLL